MSKKKSSFRMGNEFNGYGEMTYLKAIEHKTYAPLSQKNVRLTPDFSSLLPKMLGIVSVVIDSKSIENNIVIKSLGGAAIANQVILKKEESSGEYITQVQVASLGLMTGSYLQSRTSGRERIIVIPGIQPGWEKQENEGWKYINESGAYIRSDWKQHKGKWYYLNSDEYMVTDWKKISRKWYYFKPGKDSGYMVLGWRKIKDKWYYFKEEDEAGYMVFGWRKIKDKWYYFKEEDEAGYMVLGWRKIKDKWYYFKEEEEAGYMVSGWRIIEGKWYFFESDGAMAQSQIKEWNGNLYYLKEDGSMAVNDTITDPDSGKTYRVDKDGICEEISANTSMPFANMTLQQKERLIYQFDYSTEKKADEHIVTITVPIWVFEENNPTKRKISKNRKVRVNELVADDVTNIFEKIYNDSEQFPIYYSPELKYYQVEGYHYRNSRGSNKPSMHSYGAAIDINSFYNQYKIIPAASPFKVEPSGSVVRIFSEHGWYWGGEFSQKSVDYMHFSLIEKGVNSRLKQ